VRKSYVVVGILAVLFVLAGALIVGPMLVAMFTQPALEADERPIGAKGCGGMDASISVSDSTVIVENTGDVAYNSSLYSKSEDVYLPVENIEGFEPGGSRTFRASNSTSYRVEVPGCGTVAEYP
jgi:hypothetical protein